MNKNINLIEKLLKRKARLDDVAKRKTIKRRAQKKFAKANKKVNKGTK